MGLTPASGSSTAISLPKDNEHMPSTILTAPTNEHRISSKKFIKDSYHDNNAFTVGRDDVMVTKIAGFTSGSPIKTIFFHQMEGMDTKQTNTNDVSFITNDVNVSYLRINNFEIRLKAGLSFAYDPSVTTSTLNGAALIYPGFIPYVGDLFLYEIDAGQLGLFKINAPPERLSIRNDTAHEISFELIQIVGEAELTRLYARVRDTTWFNKQRYLNETAALFTRDDVQDLQFVQQKYIELVNYYFSNFYDTTGYKSFLRPDGIYDPYINNFLKTIVSSEDSGKFIQQLWPEAPYINYSLWTRMLSPNNSNWKQVALNYRIQTYTVGLGAGRVTSLINRPVLVITKDPLDVADISISRYLSDDIGGIDISVFDDTEKLIAYWIEYQVTDTDILFAIVNNIYDNDALTQFYRIPLILYFLKLLENALLTGTSIAIDSNAIVNPYLELSFTSTNSNYVNKVLTVVSPSTKVIGVIDNLGITRFFDPNDVSYRSTGFTVSFARILDLINLNEIAGTWRLVLSNPNIIH